MCRPLDLVQIIQILNSQSFLVEANLHHGTCREERGGGRCLLIHLLCHMSCTVLLVCCNTGCVAVVVVVVVVVMMKIYDIERLGRRFCIQFTTM